MNEILEFYREGKRLGIEAVEKFLIEHRDLVSQDFRFLEDSKESFFIEYASVKTLLKMYK